MKAIRTSILFLCLAGCEAGGGSGDPTVLPFEEHVTSPRKVDIAISRETARPSSAVRLRSDREMVDELRGRLSRSTRGLVREKQPDGLVRLRFGERFSHATLLRRMPDGSLRYSCVDSPRAAEAFLAATPPDPAAGTAPPDGETR
jgi:hypothetical protein